MTATWFNTPERIALLEFKAGKWIGTPFFSNGNTPGPQGGVSCQKLVAAIYSQCGFKDVEVPDVKIASASLSQVEEFMAGREDFELLEDGQPVQPGDLIAMKLRPTGHLGIVLNGRMFIHAMYHIGTVVSSLDDPTYSTRLARVWRPKEVSI
jgi:cell wall-associated NlpC family hydrolase